MVTQLVKGNASIGLPSLLGLAPTHHSEALPSPICSPHFHDGPQVTPDPRNPTDPCSQSSQCAATKT